MSLGECSNICKANPQCLSFQFTDYGRGEMACYTFNLPAAAAIVPDTANSPDPEPESDADADLFNTNLDTNLDADLDADLDANLDADPNHRPSPNLWRDGLR
ncbi:uncharacterized protein GLRG_05580 [Colletotrichum graminicola M1.001]|uniref:Apple domain-containing protein n=1 Tax=Colletotrichum graminicola (strain M1.001 / M2 / FGSC 10212) TaxID=645133 RepID=E3QHU8_COLGM|nr:uncharacterized protein GLRG_05580 [Colletotrichum graminicola M1.001]EFQ30436.1 hypothetical protein GLRG_05580 [Colletotrichum graminicola M1.001]